MYYMDDCSVDIRLYGQVKSVKTEKEKNYINDVMNILCIQFRDVSIILSILLF